MRRRVVVLGGGIAGLTCAHELSRSPDARARWAVEVVEMGHRYGGRLASAHHPERWGRNEEHGLHVWFGWYDNAFRLAEEVWRDWRAPPDCPWSSIWELLRPIWSSDHGLRTDDSIQVRRVHHARNSDRPGTTDRRSFTASWAHRADLGRALRQSWSSIVHGQTRACPHAGSGVRTAMRGSAMGGLVRALQRLASAPSVGPSTRSDVGSRVRLGARVARWAARVHAPVVAAAQRLAGTDPGARELARGVDLALAVVRGVCSPEHGILADGDLDRISDWELSAWLAHHGARPETLRDSALLMCLYDIPFAFEHGDRSRPVLEASTALRFTWRMFVGYKHAVAYLLTAGAGETIIAPLYELLRERGVRFRPFHRLHALTLSTDGRTVERLVFVRSARVIDDYDPLITRDGIRGFRPDPDWQQLVDGDALRARGVDFYSRFGDRGESEFVELQRGRDFDDVVLALPLGCIKPDGDGHSPVRAWLDGYAPARACLDKLHLVPTVAAQLWFVDDAQTVGFHERAVVTWDEPYSVVVDMTPVLGHETWPIDGPRSCAYLCGAWPLQSATRPSSDATSRADDTALAQRLLERQFERHRQPLFATDAALWTPPGADTPWSAQYVRANCEPWDLADLSLPGADRVRLEAWQSGTTNMALCGSWIRTPVNSTSVEAAVCSGLAAARALGADVRPIFAESLFRRPSARTRLPGRETPVVEDAPHARRSPPAQPPVSRRDLADERPPPKARSRRNHRAPA